VGFPHAMFEPCLQGRELCHSCDLCGDLPIVGVRWSCDVCDDFDVCENCHRTSMAMHTRGQTHAGPHAPGHATTTHPAPKDDGSPLHSGKLSDVAASAVRRWFLDALRHAKNGDAAAAALLAEMLRTGYGCAIDAAEAKYWKSVAKNGGARRVEGVYDELP